MGTLIRYVVWIMDMLKATLSFIVGIPGLIISACVGLATGFLSIVDDVAGIATTIKNFYDTTIQYGSAFITRIEGSYWDFFSSLFAIDKLVTCIGLFLSAALTVAFLALFQALFQGLVVAVPFMLYKAVSKIVKAVTIGHADAS